MLSRSYLPPDSKNPPLLAYTPMLHARLFAEDPKYRDVHFQASRIASSSSSSSSPPLTTPYLDGNPSLDRPLFVQFCANDPQHLLAAARHVAPHCDAVDLNLGCPQGIARKGHYGAFLQEDQALVYKLIHTLATELDVPVTAKIRILDTREETLRYAQNVLDAGASILTVHGRRREQKGHLTGLADWDVLRFLRERLPAETVLFANGNVLRAEDLERCLEATGADGVMAAEGNLSDPAIFAPVPGPGEEEPGEYWRGRDGKGGWRVDGMLRRYLDILYKHVVGTEPPVRRPLFRLGEDAAWMDELEREWKDAEAGEPARKKRKNDKDGSVERSANFIAVQPHLFHLLRHFVTRHTDVRDALARSRKGDLESYEKVLAMVEVKVARGMMDYERTDGKSIEAEWEAARRHEIEKRKKAAEAARTAKKGRQAKQEETAPEEEGEQGLHGESSAAAVNRCRRPWWIAQSIVRPLPTEALAKGSIQLNKKNRAMVEGIQKRADAHLGGGKPVVDGGVVEVIEEKIKEKVDVVGASVAGEPESSGVLDKDALVAG